jgi:hypothetical protein
MAVQAASSRPPTRGPRVWWRGLPLALRIGLVAGTLLLFLAVSGLLARYLSAENLEREDALALVRAEARGDVGAMLERLSGCRARASCVARVRAVASNPRVRRAGAVKLLQVESKTAGALFGAHGKTRVAWTVLGGLPVVQCLDVRRTGNPLTGIDVQLLGLSAPISNEGKCSKPSEIERDEEEVAAEAGR